MGLNICIYLWSHHHTHGNTHIHHLEKFPPASDLFYVVRVLNLRSTLLTNCSVYNAILLTTGSMLNGRPLQFSHLSSLKLDTHWTIPPHFLLPTALDNYRYPPCIYEFDYIKLWFHRDNDTSMFITELLTIIKIWT